MKPKEILEGLEHYQNSYLEDKAHFQKYYG